MQANAERASLENGFLSKKKIKTYLFKTLSGQLTARIYIVIKEKLNSNRQAHFVVASQKVKKLCAVI